MKGRSAQRGSQPTGRVVVRPTLAVHDLKRINVRQKVFQAGNCGRLTGPLLPAEQRFRRTCVPNGVLGRADDAQLAAVVGHQDPDHRGGRFSANARGPSLASSVAKTSLEILASLR